MRAEPHAERLHETGDLLLGEMERAVEGHVLHEVREPALVFVFEHRTCLDDEPKLGARLRQLVLADVIAQAVRKCAYGNERIDRNGLAEGGVSKVDGRSRLLRAPKADDRRHGEDGKQQTDAGAKSHEVLCLQLPEIRSFQRVKARLARSNAPFSEWTCRKPPIRCALRGIRNHDGLVCARDSCVGG